MHGFPSSAKICNRILISVRGVATQCSIFCNFCFVFTHRKPPSLYVRTPPRLLSTQFPPRCRLECMTWWHGSRSRNRSMNGWISVFSEFSAFLYGCKKYPIKKKSITIIQNYMLLLPLLLCTRTNIYSAIDWTVQCSEITSHRFGTNQTVSNVWNSNKKTKMARFALPNRSRIHQN